MQPLPSELVSDRAVVLGNEVLIEECFVYEYGDGKPIPNLAYQLEHGSDLVSGNTDSCGETAYVVVSSAGETNVRVIRNMNEDPYA